MEEGKKEKRRHCYHRTELERDTVEAEGGRTTGCRGRLGGVIRERGNSTAAAAGLSDPWMRAGSVLRRRSDKNAKPVFLISRRAKRFREVPAEEYGDAPRLWCPLASLVPPRPRPLSKGHPAARGMRRPGTQAASGVRRQRKKKKRCVRLHDSKTRCRGGGSGRGVCQNRPTEGQRGMEGYWQGWPPQTPRALYSVGMAGTLGGGSSCS